jgi:hypothetical protein
MQVQYRVTEWSEGGGGGSGSLPNQLGFVSQNLTGSHLKFKTHASSTVSFNLVASKNVLAALFTRKFNLNFQLYVDFSIIVGMGGNVILFVVSISNRVLCRFLMRRGGT